MTYIIYHDEEMGKVGCTNNPEKRMEEQQGLKPWSKYEIDRSDDKVKASHLEAWHKGRLSYKWDDDIYFNQNQKMKLEIRKTKAAKYFSAPHLSIEAFKAGATGGVIFMDGNDEYDFDAKDAPELLKVAQESFKTTGIYFVPKAIKNLHNGKNETTVGTSPCKHGTTIPEFQQIRDWAQDKGIFTSGDPKTQYIKLQEEAGEVAKALLKNDEPEIIDGLGDTLVVLINLSHLCGYKLEDCLQSAYDVISKRKGKMENGTFIKESL